MSDGRIALWTLCFEDGAELPEALLAMPDVSCYVRLDGEQVIAMAFAVPVRAQNGMMGDYLYGVCVHPEHRGRGLFRDLMAEAEACALGKGRDFLCLIPADERLRRTYASMGYVLSVPCYGQPCEQGAQTILPCSKEFFAYMQDADLDGEYPVMGQGKALCDTQLPPLAFGSWMGER